MATLILVTLANYSVNSWAHLLHTYNLDFGDFDFGDVNFAWSQKSPKSRDDCILGLRLGFLRFYVVIAGARLRYPAEADFEDLQLCSPLSWG